jgi:hypothetical protein
VAVERNGPDGVDDRGRWLSSTACCPERDPVGRVPASPPLPAVELFADDGRGLRHVPASVGQDPRAALLAMATAEHTGRWTYSCPCPRQVAYPSPAPLLDTQTDLWVNHTTSIGNRSHPGAVDLTTDTDTDRSPIEWSSAPWRGSVPAASTEDGVSDPPEERDVRWDLMEMAGAQRGHWERMCPCPVYAVDDPLAGPR